MKCHMCKSSDLVKFLDLGFQPLSDGFLRREQLNELEVFYPLEVYFCRNCGLVQLGFIVPPEKMYNENYPYESSTTRELREHFMSFSQCVCKRFNLPANTLVIDIGSNVGVLLSGFKAQGMKVLGVEPSKNIAKTAINNGIDTIPKFFGPEVVDKIVEKYGKAYVVTATNVFAHISDLYKFIEALKTVLHDDGIFIFEVPYLVDLINNMEYDTIYHEHLRYISMKPVVQFFEKFGMEVFDLERIKPHGGSIRVFINRRGKREITPHVKELLDLETKLQLHSLEYLQKFAKRVKEHRALLLSLLNGLKKSGKIIVGVGAPAKGNTLLNYCKIDGEMLDYTTEKAKLKIGLFTPGMHIPVYPDEKLMEDMPDYALILAWNFVDEITKNLDEYKKKGGKFIVPIPEPKIL